VAYSKVVTFTRRRTRSTLQAILPVLALVWAVLPLHHCNLAAAGQAQAVVADGSRATVSPARDELAPVDCSHHASDGAKSTAATVSCSDLGRAGPDSRPSIAVDTVPMHGTFDSRWHERTPRAHPASGVPRPQDDGRWRYRPLHLQKSALLI
jgi:hypothetical protein